MKNLITGLSLAVLCLVSSNIFSQDRVFAEPIEIKAGDTDAFTFVPPPANMPVNGMAANITVTYTGFSTEAQTAFQHAVDIWESLLNTSRTITINATWSPASNPGNLGSAGASSYWRNFSGAPQSDTFWPQPLAETLCDCDLGTDPDINANFNSDRSDWYFGTDGNTPAGEYDLVTVVLHEIGHGLGFAGGATVDGSGIGSVGLGDELDPIFYDLFVKNVNLGVYGGYTNPSELMGDVLQGSGNLLWNGSNAVAENGGVEPELYDPNPWDGGSSYSHFAESYYTAGNVNSLMTPFLSGAEAAHHPGPVSLGLLEDIGWSVNITCDVVGCTDNSACNYDSDACFDDGTCDYGQWYIPLDVEASSTPMVQACSTPSGYTLADQDCAQEVVDADTFCINVDWDSICMEAYNDCLYGEGCDWYIPDVVSGGPAIWACDAPEGYSIADQPCAQEIILADDWCVDNTWDSTCNNAYIACCPLDGCTDSTACNYDSTATCDDGSCCYDNCITLDMNDSFGDGWNGATYNITLGGVSVATGDIDSAQSGDGSNFGTDVLCLADGCGYEITVAGGTFESEITWTLNGVDGGSISGAAPETAGFSANAGCTDSTACNYDSTAGCDNGSCCYENCITLDMNDSFGDGWNGATYNITLGGVSVASGDIDSAQSGDGSSFGTDVLCLADGCYEITVAGGFFEAEITWTLNGVDGGSISGAAPETAGFSVNGTGCTDSTACNYDSTACADDGSCEFANVIITVGGGTFDSEITWSLDLDGTSVASGGAPADVAICEVAGCYTMTMNDALGDGWNGATYDITVDGVSVASGDIDSAQTGDGSSFGTDAVGIGGSCGCTDSTACNYDSTADVDNGSCLFDDACGVCGGSGTVAGCTDSTACNYDSTADCDDGSCVLSAGCTDSTACNYDSTASCDDGSCLLPDGCTDSTACNYDSTAQCDDGSCLVDYGCNDSIACNYDSAATCDDGSCTYLDNPVTDLTAYNWILEYDIDCNGGPGSDEYTFDADQTFLSDENLSGMWSLCSGFYMNDFSSATTIYEGSWDGEGFTGTFDNGINFSGCFTLYPIIPGCTDSTACNYDSLATDDDGSCLLPDGCTDSTACNYDSTAQCDDGSCLVDYGCNDSIACNYDSAATCDDGSCTYLDNPVTDLTAYNWILEYDIDCNGGPGSDEYTFDADQTFLSDENLSGMWSLCSGFYMNDFSSATTIYEGSWDGEGFTGTFDNGINFSGCFTLYPIIPGCTDSTACNYDSLATDDDGSCLLPDGCTDSTACNYDSTAQCDDGSCLVDYGCNDSIACNYDSAATCDDGSCTYLDNPVTDLTAYNWILEYDIDCNGGPGSDEYTFDADQTFLSDENLSGMWSLCSGFYMNDFSSATTIYEGSWDGEGFTGTFDNGINFSGCFTLYPIIPGCTDSTACNYDSLATDDDGSCLLPDGCTDSTACNYDSTAQCDDGSCLVDYGCNDSIACNYDSAATCDDGSCTYLDNPVTDLTAYNWILEYDIDCNGGPGSDEYTFDADQTFLSDENLSGMWSLCSGFYMNDFSSATTIYEGSWDGEGFTGTFDNGINFSGCFTLYPIIPGCTDSTACNYDSLATDDDGSCLLPDGCTDSTACNYDSTATCDDGSCVLPNGCTDSAACNYDSTATCDDGSCVLPNGCTDSTACNYDSTATCDDGSCTYLDNPVTDMTTYDWTFSWDPNCLGSSDEAVINFYADQSWGDPWVIGTWSLCGGFYMHNYGGSSPLIYEGSWDGTGFTGTFDNGTTFSGCFTLYPIIPGCTDSTACNYDSLATDDDGSCVLPDGCTDSTACNYDSTAQCDDGSCLVDYGCNDSIACNYDSAATCDDGSCTYLDNPVTDMTTYDWTFSWDPNCLGSSDEAVINFYADQSWGDPWVIGTWSLCGGFYMHNYGGSSPLIYEGSWDGTGFTGTFDNGTTFSGCFTLYPIIPGCTDSTACNYDSLATDDDGSCVLPDGCTDSTACNYDSTAQCDDGSCLVDYGCNDSIACNYDSAATCDDGSCTYLDNPVTDMTTYDWTFSWDPNCLGSSDEAVINFYADQSWGDPWVIGTWSLCGGFYMHNYGGSSPLIYEGSWDGTGFTGTFDNGTTFSGCFTLYPIIPGCTDSTACNYDSLATDDDGSCVLPDGCTDSTACNYDSTAQCDDGSCLVDYGCNDSIACNYDSAATCDDGSCTYLDNPVTDMTTYDWTFSWDPNCLGSSDEAVINFYADQSWGDPWVLGTWSLCGGFYMHDYGSSSPLIYEGSWDGTGFTGTFDDGDDWSGCFTLYPIIPGCTDSTACNYDSTATTDDGSCVLPNGCTDSAACNYDSTATCDDGSCVLPNGCTDSAACNYDSTATCDDGSCVLPNGCTDSTACNYDSTATCDDGSCEFASCACPGDFNGSGTIGIFDLLYLLAEFGCTSDCTADLTGDGEVNSQDLLAFLPLFGTTCP